MKPDTCNQNLSSILNGQLCKFTNKNGNAKLCQVFYHEILRKSVPVRYTLFTGTVPVRYALFTGTVPVRYALFTGTVPVNNLFLS